MGNTTLQEMLERVETIRPTIEEHADASEAQCQLAPEIYDALVAQDLFAMSTPSAFGGLEMDLVDGMQVVEAVSAIDGATGWNLNQSLGIVGIMVWLPDAMETIFADPNVILAGALWPPAPAREVDGGIRVSGRMPFVSGSRYAKWALGPAMLMDGEVPRSDPDTGAPEFIGCIYSIDDMTFTDDWNPTGMRGTGSNDGIVEDVFIPDARMTRIIGATSRPRPAEMANPNYGVVPFTGVLLHAMVPLGIARGALEETMDIVADKVPNYFEQPLREKPVVQSQLAQATAILDAARAYVLAETVKAVERAKDGPMSTETRIALQLAACHAASATTQALDLISDVAGTSAIKRGRPLERRMRDARTIVRHVSLQHGRYESAGMAMLGLESDWFPFNV